jgi:hypothetical protein
MKKYLPLLLLSVFLVVLCGAPEGPAPEEKTKENIGYGALTEGELQRFIKAVPVFKTEVEKKEEDWEALESPANVGMWLGQFSTLNKDIAGLDAK